MQSDPFKSIRDDEIEARLMFFCVPLLLLLLIAVCQ